MTVLSQPAELNAGCPVCLAIGVFDGVHLGHQQVIRQAVNDAEQQEGVAVVVTFDRHPKSVVAPERAPGLIYSVPQRLRAIAALGVDATWVIAFDRGFSQQSADRFVRNLALEFRKLYSICVGANFVFGHERSGNVDVLRALGRELGFLVRGLAAVSLDQQVVSSTRVREAIRAGQFELIDQMLGREYTLAGTVVRGDQIGQALGFPTANIETAGRVIPPNGVYAVHATLDGKRHRAVLNIGYRPTLQRPTPQLRVEAHLLDFLGELYGRDAEITFRQKLRDEQGFPSLEALRRQIEKDVAEARRVFAS